jgi:hypothetical protein
MASLNGLLLTRIKAPARPIVPKLPLWDGRRMPGRMPWQSSIIIDTI